MRRPVLLISAVTLGCYSYLLLTPSAGFVFDDKRFVLYNEAAHQLSVWPTYFTDPTTIDPTAWTGIYRPIRTLDFALDWAIAGASPWWFHLRSVIYHLVGAILILVLLRRWGAGEIAATLGALVFATHPVQVEAAGWITSRGDLLCLIFFAGALIIHHRCRGFDRSFAAAAGLMVLAMLSKEAAVMFPAAVLMADFTFRDERRWRETLKRWPQYLTYASLAAIYFGLWNWMHLVREAPTWHLNVRWGDSFLGTLLTMSRGFVYYFRLLLFPVDMSTDWYLTPIKTPDILTLACVAGILGLIAVSTFRFLKGGAAWAFAVLWLFVTMFPTSNLPAPIGIPTAERFLNLPMIGMALAAGLYLGRVWGWGRAGRNAVIVLIACLGLVSFRRAMDWKTDRTIWTATLSRFDSPRGLEWRAEAAKERGANLKREAEVLAGEGLEDEALLMGVQGRDLLEDAVRDYDLAMARWRRLPATGPTLAVIRAKRAFAWFELGRVELALAEADEALKTPVLQLIGIANLVRGLSLHAQGEFRAAALAMDIALHWEDRPAYRRKAAAVYQDLARWYNEPGRENRARTYLALRRSWELYDGPENRGVYDALTQMEEEFAALMAPLAKARQEKSADAEVYRDLAILYALQGDWDASRRIFEDLLSAPQTDRDPRVLDPFAFYCCEMRDTEDGYDEARRIYEEIREKAPDWPGIEEAIERVDREKAALVQAQGR